MFTKIKIKNSEEKTTLAPVLQEKVDKVEAKDVYTPAQGPICSGKTYATEQTDMNELENNSITKVLSQTHTPCLAS